MNYQKFLVNIQNRYSTRLNIEELKKEFSNLELLKDFIYKEHFIKDTLLEIIQSSYPNQKVLNIQQEKKGNNLYIKINTNQSINFNKTLLLWIDFLSFYNKNYTNLAHDDYKKLIPKFIQYQHLQEETTVKMKKEIIKI